jgi:translation initiation factor 2 subunit 3
MTDTMKPTLVIREAEVLERQATHLIGTLGHVSEGKSTLIRALTGVKTQRHAKEQERNITIHLGYANCKVYQNRDTGELVAQKPPATGTWDLTAHLSWVDCPGHEAFLATMLGGASIMDTACLIVAANQEVVPQPQTLEHLLAAELMGLERIAIAQNKLDLLTAAAATKNNDAITAFTTDTIAEKAPHFPISAQHGWGVGRVLDWVTSLAPPTRDLHAPARLTCVRSFDVNRPGQFRADSPPLAGAVIGGTLEQGVLAIGDWIEIRPGILKRGRSGGIAAQPILTRVRGIRCESTELPYAVPGSLIALATDLDPGLSIANGMIGQRVGVPGSLPPIVKGLVLRFRKLKREAHSFGKHRVGDVVRLCSNVATVEGKITNIDDKKRVHVSIERPLCVGIGENVGVLRFHKEAGRELIEGLGEVRAVTGWSDIEEPEGAAAAAGPNRDIVWEPLARHEWSATAVPEYASMMADVMAHAAEMGASTRLRLAEPVTERIPKHTVWVNWAATTTGLDTVSWSDTPYKEHLKEYVEAELQTTANVNGQEQLVIRGNWKIDDLRGLLRKYVVAYKRCAQCHGYETGLAKIGKVLKVRCTRCLTDNVIA